MLADPTIIAHQNFLLENIAQQLVVNPVPIQLILVAPCGDEVHERVARDLNVQALNASHTDYIFQILLPSELFDHHAPLGRLITVLIGPAETGKT